MAAPESQLTFSALGPIEIRANGQLLELPGITTNRLLAALLIRANSWVSDSQLIKHAWGEAGATANALHCAISRMRRTFRYHLAQDDVIQRATGSYRITASSESLDILRFIVLVDKARSVSDPDDRFVVLLKALHMWRGPFAEGVSESLADIPEIVALERVRVDCVCELADLGALVGRNSEALPIVEELATSAPYDEPLQARFITLTGLVGRRAEALRHFERIRQRFSEDLGVTPSKALRDAHTALLTASDL